MPGVQAHLDPAPSIMHTDVSSTMGWGTTLNGSTCGSPWSAAEKKHYINFLELKTVLLALQSWESLVSGKHVRVMVCRGVGMGKQVGSMDEESQVRGCYNITFICTPTNLETVSLSPPIEVRSLG